MKFIAPKSTRVVNVNVNEYLIDWDRKVSGPQKAVSDFLRPYWKNQIVLLEFRVPTTLWRVDLMNLTKKCAIEVSPRKSHSFNKFFHKSKVNFGSAMKREIEKVEWLEKNGFTVIEIYDEDIPVLSREWFLTKYDITL